VSQGIAERRRVSQRIAARRNARMPLTVDSSGLPGTAHYTILYLGLSRGIRPVVGIIRYSVSYIYIKIYIIKEY
jgi:hypothetical protein